MKMTRRSCKYNQSATFSLQGVSEDCNVTESTNYAQYFKDTLASMCNEVGYKYITFQSPEKESPFPVTVLLLSISATMERTMKIYLLYHMWSRQKWRELHHKD